MFQNPLILPAAITMSIDSLEDWAAVFAQRNTESLLQMNGPHILLSACTQLSFLTKYIQRYKDALNGTAFLMPGTLSQALTMRNRWDLVSMSLSVHVSYLSVWFMSFCKML